MTNRHPHALGAALALVAGVLGATPAAAQAGDWRAEVASLLTARARAVEQGDERALGATTSGAPEEFARRDLAWFRRLRSLGVAEYDLRLEPEGFGDLAPALRRRPSGDEVHVVEVAERTALSGFDPAPVVEARFLTVVRRGTRWSVLADDDLDDLGLRSARNVWDFGPVQRLERGGVMAVFHPGDRGSARRLVDAAREGTARTGRAWPFPWDDRVVLMVPGSAEELERIFQATFDLGPFVAFTSSSVERDPAWALTGHRVFVQPDTFFDHSDAVRQEFLGHELLHHATRAYAGPFVPAWLDEGVAQLYGERSPALRFLPGRVRAGRFDGRLPEDWEFVVGTRPDIQTQYDEALSFSRFLERRFGRGATARFYRAVGRISADSLGTGRYHLDRAARRTFGITMTTLELDWGAETRSTYS